MIVMQTNHKDRFKKVENPNVSRSLWLINHLNYNCYCGENSFANASVVFTKKLKGKDKGMFN